MAQIEKLKPKKEGTRTASHSYLVTGPKLRPEGQRPLGFSSRSAVPQQLLIAVGNTEVGFQCTKSSVGVWPQQEFNA